MDHPFDSLNGQQLFQPFDFDQQRADHRAGGFPGFRAG